MPLCAWKSLICVTCLVFPYFLLWLTLLTCSCRASVTATSGVTRVWAAQGGPWVWPPVQLNALLGIWMQHGDLKKFILTHHHTEARNHFSKKKTRNPYATLKTHVTPLHVLRNPDEEWAGLYFSTYAEIHFDEHKSNYTFIRFTQKCF